MIKRCLSLIWVLPLVLYMVGVFSPRLSYQFFTAWDHSVRVTASTHACSLHRNGRFHEDAVSCTLQYVWNGQPAETIGDAWTSAPDSIFTTRASLHHQLDQLNAGQKITIDVGSDDPHQVTAVPQWFSAPRWALVTLLYIALVAYMVYWVGGGFPRPERRADFDYDETGQLVRVHGHDRAKPSRISTGIPFSLLFILTLYCLSNSPANHLTLITRMLLVKVPAQLEQCEAHYHGSGKSGHSQVECRVAYQWGNHRFVGQADAIDFRLFPFFGRDDDAAQQAEGRKVFAWVDPAQPDYAIAFVNDNFFAPQRWGLMELTLFFCLYVCANCIWFPDRFLGRRRQNAAQ